MSREETENLFGRNFTRAMDTMISNRPNGLKTGIVTFPQDPNNLQLFMCALFVLPKEFYDEAEKFGEDLKSTERRDLVILDTVIRVCERYKELKLGRK